MADTDDSQPIASLHRPDRGCDFAERRDAPAARFPGLIYQLPTPYPQPKGVDLSTFSRPLLARQMAICIWNDFHHNVGFKSFGTISNSLSTLSRLDDFLTQADPECRIEKIEDITSGDLDTFDKWAHAAWPAGSEAPYNHLSRLIILLKSALRNGFVHPALATRLDFVSRWHTPVASTPRDAYSPHVMAQIRLGARKAVRKTVLRMRRARKMPATSASNDADGVLLELRDVGFRYYVGRDLKLRAAHGRLLDQLHPRLADLFPFAILIAYDCGLPPECIWELAADCLDEVDTEVGFGFLTYTKRRRDGAAGAQEPEYVKTRERWSTGWLIKLLLAITATTRKQMSATHQNRLFVARALGNLKSPRITQQTVASQLKAYPVEDDDGEPLKSIVLSRIRKTVKSARYQEVGGDLHRIGKDHTRKVFVRNYARIASLEGTHDAVVADALEEALGQALGTKVVVSGGQEADALLGTSELWLANCRDFYDSPYMGETRACGAPFWGCLDCGNAVVTKSKLPSLLRLLEHLRGKRQEMSLAEFTTGFGFAFVRLQQILAQFPPADVQEAIDGLGDDFGPDWTLAQLAYAV